ncbi:energy-coupling factor transporter transmembrane protein EcfT [Thiocapsa bogorovii]|uniref:energy-coupling factor transporter transmembrane protein EcfT n=1 Tax=Thiocapsa bogorovii TaxID=521689 RepID=UPI001E47BFFC|nr:energy-coupling factor transporter transmembrane protein EcfT [Thiocapsa bogorovii]UHD16553.1 energy-coupling factor transporter transmembrane protein EcfT [Thiocapsa bogorovii]
MIAATAIHDPWWLAAGLLVVAVLAGRQAPTIGWRALRAVLFFNLVISVGYAAGALFGQAVSLDYLILINIRVYLLTFLTFTLASRIDILRALRFSRNLTYLVTLVLSQIITFRRLFEDLRLAAESRRLRRLRLRERYLLSAATAVHLFDRAEHDAREIALAMRSRGFFQPDAVDDARGD